MRSVKDSSERYFDTIRERSKKSRVHQPYQLAGLEIAAILEDPRHKALYIKLAKNYNGHELIQLAKRVAEKKDVKNKGAYFMKTLQSLK